MAIQESDQLDKLHEMIKKEINDVIMIKWEYNLKNFVWMKNMIMELYEWHSMVVIMTN